MTPPPLCPHHNPPPFFSAGYPVGYSLE
jgi:hypothetical protein